MTADEAYRASRMLLPRWVPIAIGLGALLILIAGITLVASGEPELGAGLLVGALIVLASRPLVRWLSMRRIRSRLALVPEPLIVALEADGIRATRGASSSLVSWGDVVSVDGRGPFVWVQGRASAIYAIPRRAFEGDADAERFMTAANGFKQAASGS